MEAIIHVVLAVLVFALVAAALWFICTKFFAGNQIALWIGGGVMVIVLLICVANLMGYGGSGLSLYPMRR